MGSKIEISTGYIIDQENKQDSTVAKNDIRNVNFMDDKIDWTTLIDLTKDKIENTLCEDESTEEIKQFIKLLQGISLEKLPRKNKRGKEKDTPWKKKKKGKKKRTPPEKKKKKKKKK